MRQKKKKKKKKKKKNKKKQKKKKKMKNTKKKKWNLSGIHSEAVACVGALLKIVRFGLLGRWPKRGKMENVF